MTEEQIKLIKLNGECLALESEVADKLRKAASTIQSVVGHPRHPDLGEIVRNAHTYLADALEVRTELDKILDPKL